MATDSIQHQLENAFPFIRSLSPDDRRDLLAQCWHSVIPAGTVIMNEDIKCSGVTLIVNGLVRIYKLSDEGREVTLYRIGRGETCVLTAACLLGSGTIPYPVSAVTEHDTLMVIVPLEFFRRIFNTDEAARNFVFSAMAGKFYTVLGLVENITFKRTNERLLDLLISKTGGGAYPLYATHEAIASELGTAREVVSRLLKEFEQEGMLKLQRGKVTLLSLTSHPAWHDKAENGSCTV
jgi:CRP/FNR family transcriptional regulator